MIVDLVRRLVRAYGLTEEEATRLVDERLLFTLQLQDIEPPEWSEVYQTRLAVGTITQAAVAAERSVCQLVNPTGSGVILVLDGWIAHTTAADDLTEGSQAAAQATVDTTKRWRDRRLIGQPVAEVRSGTNAAAVGVAWAVHRAIANESYQWPPSWPRHSPAAIISPGGSHHIQKGTVNQSLAVSWWWREVRFENTA